MANTNINIRMDADLKRQFEAFCADMGMTMTTAFNVFARKAGCRECHITPDWLLIYEVDGDELILYLTRTGSHSDLF